MSHDHQKQVREMHVPNYFWGSDFEVGQEYQRIMPTGVKIGVVKHRNPSCNADCMLTCVEKANQQFMAPLLASTVFGKLSNAHDGCAGR